MKQEFLLRIDEAREEANVPFRINSGFRCPEHNEAVGGKDDSSHLKGWGADISCISAYHRFRMVKGLIKAGFTRIHVGKDYLHTDLNPDKAEEVIWL